MHTQISVPDNFSMASLLSSYPNENFAQDAKYLLENANINLPESLRDGLNYFLTNEQTLNDMRSQYIEIFDNSKSLNPLYETEYGRERVMFKANELSDISAFYRAFGFVMDQDHGTREILDHVAVELEFYTLLLTKYHYLYHTKDQEGVEIVYDAMQKFLKDHLGRFTKSILIRPGVQENSYYRSIFTWINSLVEKECQSLNVKPDEATWFASQIAGDQEMCCGTTGGISKN